MHSRYKWYILALSILTFGIVVGVDRMCLPVLFKEISVDLNLSLVSLGTIWGMDPLAGMFVGLPAGLLVDRFGIKRTLSVICVLCGVFCALRGFSVNLLTMLASMFLFGGMTVMVAVIMPKVTVVWFEKRLVGLHYALFIIGSSLGSIAATMTSATVLSPLLGGWRNVLILFGLPTIIIGLLWFFTGKEPVKKEPQTIPASNIPFREALTKVIHNKEVWILSLIFLCFLGVNMGLSGYIPLYLRDIGWTAVEADGAFTAFNAANSAGMVPMTLLAIRLRANKGMLFFSMAALSVFLFLLPMVNGAAIWAVLIIGAFLRSGASAIINTLVLDIKGIGNTCGGTALGMLNSISMIGGVLAPPLGNSLAHFGPGMPFFLWAGMSVISLPLFLFLRRS
jgi:MFS family permease